MTVQRFLFLSPDLFSFHSNTSCFVFFPVFFIFFSPPKSRCRGLFLFSTSLCYFFLFLLFLWLCLFLLHNNPYLSSINCHRYFILISLFISLVFYLFSIPPYFLFYFLCCFLAWLFQAIFSFPPQAFQLSLLLIFSCQFFSVLLFEEEDTLIRLHVDKSQYLQSLKNNAAVE